MGRQMLALVISAGLITIVASASPGKPYLQCGNCTFSIIEVNQTAKAYNQLVTKKDAADVSISWTVLTKEPVDNASVLNNDEKIWFGSGNLTSAAFKMKKGGRYQMKVELCNSDGCSFSDSTEIVVADTDGSHLPPLNQSIVEANKPFKQTSRKVFAVYFAEWRVYRKEFPINQVPIPNLTHLMYTFITVCGGADINDSIQKTNSYHQTRQISCSGREDFKVSIHDPWAALQKPYANLKSPKQPYMGNFGQLMLLKQAKPDLKIIASIGDWILIDRKDLSLFTNKTIRHRFVASVKDFLETWKFFDGVDLYWEFPGGKVANPHLGGSKDIYVLLMKELREILDELSTKTGRKYELTAAISSTWDMIQAVDYKGAQQYLDHVFLMSYDFKSEWATVNLGHHTALYAPAWNPKENYTADFGIKCLLAQGMHPEKIVLGVAMYGRGWTGVHDYKDNNPFSGVATGPVKGTWQRGVVDYREIANEIAQGKWEYHYDEVAQAPYVFRKDTGDLITYDDARSTIEKGKYVRNNKLGGLFAWEINADNGDILNAMDMGLGNNCYQLLPITLYYILAIIFLFIFSM